MMHRAYTRIGWAMLLAAVSLAAKAGTATATDRVGDCNKDGVVTVDELLTGVHIALGGLEVSSCAPLDVDGDSAVSIDELVLAVNVALAGPPQQLAFVVATDFETGSFATVSLDQPRTVQPTSPQRSVNSDAVGRTYGGLVYVVNRLNGDNIQVLDPAHNFATVLQCSTGAGSDPNDIAFVSATKAYVALFGNANVLIVNPSAQPDCSDFVLGIIDLSAYADADGIPDMSQLVIVGNRLYVSLQRLTNFVPALPGAIAVIDTGSDVVVNAITLSGTNPFAQTKGLTVSNGAIVISEVGQFGVNDGGLERVDLTSETAEGFVYGSEAELGGDVTDFALVSADLAYAIISKPDFTNALIAFNPRTRQVTQTLISSGSFSDIELDDRGELFLADRSLSKPGIRVFRASDGTELTPAPLNLGLPPFDIVFVP